MTKLNKITSVLLSAIMVIGIFSVIPFVAGAETKGTSDSFEYSVLDDGTASITKYVDNGSKTVDIPSTIDGYEVTKIGWSAFGNCTGLNNVTIPNSVTYIGSWAFKDCTGLKSITIPNSVTKIDAFAFRGCTGLKSVTIPKGVIEIRDGAFLGCTGLISVTIPSSVTDVSLTPYTETGAFDNCTGLKNITVDKNNKNYASADGVLFNKDKTKILLYPIAKGSLSYVIPNSVTEIVVDAFRDCTGLESVTIPNSVTKIGWQAFAYCTGLKSITIPNSVTKIGDDAFRDCTGLTSVTIPSSVTEIDEWAFNGCTSLKSVTIPSSVTEIGDYAFGYTYDDTLVKIKDFTIYGTKGTEAERYANLHDFKFVEGVAPVEPAVPTGVKLNQSSLTLGKGESYGLVSTVLPANAKNKTCTWSTSNSSIATVSNTGKVTAKAVGTAVITVKTVNGKTATCKVTVKLAPTSIKTNPTSLTLGKGEKYTISESTNSGSYANAANLKWTSTNTKVATVQKGSGNKAVVKAVGTGTADVKITLFNGKTATCKVTVRLAPTSIKTNPTSLTLGKGESYTISESTNSGSYANATNLKWTSTNTKVVTVQKGSGNKAVVKAVGTGTADVKITLFNGKTATCKVTVKPAPTSIKTNPTSLTLGKGESYTISESTNSGSYANAANLKWTSTNTKVVTVQKGSGNKA
ncbi:MAG: leucine-rich repeat protein, partial [Ruminococcus sp.]|nr:leucine-rich repeat protein [Ruminococcus sp.]